jgi:arylsulfatase A-like enzyme
MTADRKNLLFIFTDQMHAFCMGCAGDPLVRTPTLDRLAEEGVLFSAAYSNCPVCTPFRANLFTGLYGSQTGVLNNGQPLPEGCPTLADRLEAGGVRTSYVGKWHLGGAGNQPIPPELRGGFTDFIGYQCYNGFYEGVCFYDEDGREHRFDKHRTEATTELALQRLERLVDQPFALFVSYQSPHYPEMPPPEYAALYAGAEVPRRPNRQEVDPYTRTYSPPSPQPPEEDPIHQRYGNDLDEYIRLYDAMVTQIDDNVARLLAALERHGVAETTTVVFTSDHGDLQGSHGGKNKRSFFEESARIPLLVRTPGGLAGAVCAAPVSAVDFYPTCLELAGLPVPGELPGQSLVPALTGRGELPGLPAFAEDRGGWDMVRSGPWKLVTEQGRPTHLYNLEDDPYELENLVERRELAATRAELQELLGAWAGRVRAGAGEGTS